MSLDRTAGVVTPDQRPQRLGRRCHQNGAIIRADRTERPAGQVPASNGTSTSCSPTRPGHAPAALSGNESRWV
jgi:hypothetical protein